MKKIVILAALVFAFCACQDEANSLESLKNQAFIIEKLELNGKTLLPSVLQDEKSSLAFEDGKYHGFAACNGFFGSFSLKGGKVRINADGGATKMMCPPEVMGFEDDLLGHFYGDFALEKEGENLVLKSDKIKIYLRKE